MLRLTPAQVTEVAQLPDQTLRHWRSVLPPLAGLNGYTPCFTPGDALALLVIRYLVKVMGISVGALALAIGLIAFAGEQPAFAFAAMALFGLAYIVSTGALLLWGIAILKDQPALGLGYPFLVVALGQTAGAPLFGMVYDQAGSGPALGGAALAMAASAIPISSRR